MMYLNTLSDFLRDSFGEKLYRLSLSCADTCPNRDGTVGTGGCAFCAAGSGSFAQSCGTPVGEQIERAKAVVAQKFRGSRYIAYFQAYTNTYAPEEQLRALFTPVVEREDIAVLSVATRPDCLPEEVLDLLGELNQRKPVWVELGLQTIHPATAAYLRRGYDLACYDRAVAELSARGIHVVTHVILYLPGETREQMLETVRYVGRGHGGIKLQLLHVLEGTDLAAEYRAGRVPLPTLEEYVALVRDCVALLPEDTVVHRMTGDGPKRILIAPQWSGDKKRVLNALNRALGRT